MCYVHIRLCLCTAFQQYLKLGLYIVNYTQHYTNGPLVATANLFVYTLFVVTVYTKHTQASDKKVHWSWGTRDSGVRIWYKGRIVLLDPSSVMSRCVIYYSVCLCRLGKMTKIVPFISQLVLLYESDPKLKVEHQVTSTTRNLHKVKKYNILLFIFPRSHR